VRPTVASRVSAGESLRALAREYQVSHETIRRRLNSADTDRRVIGG
jgi:hypothetical protein